MRQSIYSLLFLLLSITAQAQNGDTFATSYKNRIVTISVVHIDTTYYQSLESDEQEYSMSIKKHQQPILLIGEKIYNSSNVNSPVQLENKKGNLKTIIKDLLSQEMSQMNEFGEVQIVIDEEGKLAYLHVSGLQEGSSDIEKAIAKKIEEVHFFPAQRNGNFVHYYFEITK